MWPMCLVQSFPKFVIMEPLPVTLSYFVDKQLWEMLQITPPWRVWGVLRKTIGKTVVDFLEQRGGQSLWRHELEPLPVEWSKTQAFLRFPSEILYRTLKPCLHIRFSCGGLRWSWVHRIQLLAQSLHGLYILRGVGSLGWTALHLHVPSCHVVTCWALPFDLPMHKH